MPGILKLKNGRQKGVNDTTPNYRQNINPKNRNAILSEPTRKRSNAFEVVDVGPHSSKRLKPSTSQMQRGSSNGGQRSSEGNHPNTTPVHKPLGPSNVGHRSSEGNLPTTTPIRTPLGSMNKHGPDSSRKKKSVDEDVIYDGTNQFNMLMEGLNKENEEYMDDLSTRQLAVMTNKKLDNLLDNLTKAINDKFEMVFDILKSHVKEKGTGNANKEKVAPYHDPFMNNFVVNLYGEMVKLDAIEGGRKQLGLLVYQKQDIWKCPSFNGKSLKQEIRTKFLPVIFQLIDWPTKIAYAVSQYLWPKTHFATHYMTSFNEGLGKTSDPNLKMIPADEKNLFLEIMLFCGGYLIERRLNSDGKPINGDNWLKWANFGREGLNARGLQMQKGKSDISWWIDQDIVPLFCRTTVQLDKLPDLIEDEGEDGHGHGLLDHQDYLEGIMPEENLDYEESNGDDGMNAEDRVEYERMMARKAKDRQVYENMMEAAPNATNNLDESREEGECSSYGESLLSRRSSMTTESARARRENLKRHNYKKMHHSGIQSEDDEY